MCCRRTKSGLGEGRELEHQSTNILVAGDYFPGRCSSGVSPDFTLYLRILFLTSGWKPTKGNSVAAVRFGPVQVPSPNPNRTERTFGFRFARGSRTANPNPKSRCGKGVHVGGHDHVLNRGNREFHRNYQIECRVE